MASEVKVVIVGGGAAGLAATAEFERWGVSCLLLEAQSRLGGRVHTVSRPGEVPFECGAQTINGDMTAVLALAAEADLHLSPVPLAGRDLCFVNGEVLPRTDLVSDEEVAMLLTDAIRSWSSPQDAWNSIRSLYRWWTTPWESLGEAKRGVALAASGSKPEKGSIGAAIQRLLLCAEDEAIARTMVAEQICGDPDEINAAAVKRGFEAYGSDRGDLEFQFPSGMIRIVEALAAKLSCQPILNAPVDGISVCPHGVEVATKNEVFTAERVIATAPPTVARGIAFDMAHRRDLYRLLTAFSAGDMIKTRLTYDSAFWRTDGRSGAISFGSPMGLEVRDTSYDTDARPQLTAYLGGPVARQRAALSKDARTEKLLTELAKVLGDEARRPVAGDESVWVDHPWSGGGYNAYVRTGQPSDAVTRLASWPGPVHFAGAELDTEFAGYVEGALRSGRRVAGRVARELRSDAWADHGQ
ncbi:NAD(P)/FAD-dependent oxidoreductase [uncultured Ruegeria sp.]|uniref:flavin monoamine oxidase family protein n=1 Tax=uncultured Ruegeria sp. TaxID=259304 RepID=UPI0026214E2B|nr:NAD(P)/FAD-dependent oxidoreductase [uncultured Ruegeria sp.]